MSNTLTAAPRIGLGLRSVEIEQARRKLIRFIKAIKPDYDANWHHEAICAALDRFEAGYIKNLIILVPPQHGKSEISSRMFPAYKLGKSPKTKIAVCSYSSDLSSAFNRDAQRIIDSPEYLQIFPDTRLNYKNVSTDSKGSFLRNSDIFEIVKHKGFFKSAFVRGALTGTALDIGIIDDPFKDRIEAESERVRQIVWDWYIDVFSTRLHNNSQQLVLLTRWHEDDLAGRILAADEERFARGEDRQWTVIKFPAIKEDDSDPQDPREIGEALWESRHSRQRILEQKEKSERTFNSLYQQNPRPLKGNIIKTDKFGRITWEEFLMLTKNKVVEWQFKVDTAYTEKTENDPTAIISSCLIDNITYIRRVKSVRLELPELIEFIPEFTALNGYGFGSYIRIEPKASGLSTIQAIKKGTKLNVERFKFPKVNGVRLDDKDKVTRAHAITDFIHVGRVVIIDDGTNWDKGFIEQCKVFPKGKHDDEVDVFVMQMLENYFAPEQKRIENTN